MRQQMRASAEKGLFQHLPPPHLLPVVNHSIQCPDKYIYITLSIILNE